MTPTGPIEEADLHACIDGQLPPERTASVEVYLAGHSAERARLDYGVVLDALSGESDLSATEVLRARLAARENNGRSGSGLGG